MAVGEIERQGCIEEVVGRRAVGLRIVVGNRLLLAFEDTLRSAVVVAGADVELMADGINGGRLPDRTAAVAARLTTVIRHGVGLPKELAAVSIQCHYTAAEGAASIGNPKERGEREELFL